MRDEQDYDEPDRWQAAIDRTMRERLVEGWGAPGGWVRRGDPMCPEHRYGLVEGMCGECLLEKEWSTLLPAGPPSRRSENSAKEAA